ncbi:hypothetical protein lerEdw1_012920 [Lerista edwardsae]|nr:hypothetical protein lerEdw1_012920 [Lerista edwardsae]
MDKSAVVKMGAVASASVCALVGGVVLAQYIFTIKKKTGRKTKIIEMVRRPETEGKSVDGERSRAGLVSTTLPSQANVVDSTTALELGLATKFSPNEFSGIYSPQHGIQSPQEVCCGPRSSLSHCIQEG